MWLLTPELLAHGIILAIYLNKSIPCPWAEFYCHFDPSRRLLSLWMSNFGVRIDIILISIYKIANGHSSLPLLQSHHRRAGQVLQQLRHPAPFSRGRICRGGDPGRQERRGTGRERTSKRRAWRKR